jgi:hypothetical protein
VNSLQEAIDAIKRSNEEHGLARLFSMHYEYSNEWHRFLSPSEGTNEYTLKVKLDKSRFPYLFQSKKVTIYKASLLLIGAIMNDQDLRLELNGSPILPPADPQKSFIRDSLRVVEVDLAANNQPDIDGPVWELKAWLDDGAGGKIRLPDSALDEMLILCHYKIT